MKHENDLQMLLVIPLYNHGATIGPVVEKALITGYPVLVVDDGSEDGGLKNVAHLQCHSLRFDENRGKGAAIMAAIAYAAEHGYDAICTMDADGQHDPADAIQLIDSAHEGRWPAVVIGDRAMIQETVPGSSHFGKKFSNFWVRLECGEELNDTQSGMRVYPVQELLDLELSCSRYDFEIEALVKLVWGGVAVRSVPVSVHYPSRDERVSHFDKLRDNWRLSMLHTRLVVRRLLPFQHKRLVKEEEPGPKVIDVKNPWQTLKNLCQESASPFWLAVAVWFGLFLGALPLIACHTIAIIYVTYRFRLNKIAAVAASQFCMPPVVPALCIEVGYFMRTGTFLLDLSWERWTLEIHQRLFEWLIGSMLVGPILGVAGGTIVYWFSRKMVDRPIETVG
ncbi:DUF2062 domain-containing protein [Desulfosediminicola sp.]|uniref:DUF2062 domain-containing protein n=1 Tax=Desulfosediminicola sp. TaxID=2886825 RepID=UPI003AF1ED1E